MISEGVTYSTHLEREAQANSVICVCTVCHSPSNFTHMHICVSNKMDLLREEQDKKGCEYLG